MLRLVNDILQAKGMMMRTGTAVDATLISAPSSTKNADGERDPEMKQTKKGNNWYFGMKAHIGVDAARAWCTRWWDGGQRQRPQRRRALLHGEEKCAFGDAGYQGVHKRPKLWGRRGTLPCVRAKRKKLNPFIEPDFVAERVEKMKASIRAKVEHPFRVIKRSVRFSQSATLLCSDPSLSRRHRASSEIVNVQGWYPSKSPARACAITRHVMLKAIRTKPQLRLTSRIDKSASHDETKCEAAKRVHTLARMHATP
jgi:hypothetical protein